ncbi:MAG: A/G-specific adenine glycosylase [Flavobacteriales bacterium]|nr:A/G-specific adenine glycosylase [Flavobacteriales bacterium]MEB2342044.1 A/G-specific adenine glycosylase [Flavobacteriia bacterium]
MPSASWFSRQLRPWYREHQRPLPWRQTRDPYRIWLSEVILQQTRVDQGLAYYERFVDRWPTVARLAAAGEHEVLKLWQGLGYYSRARNLLAAARQVMQEHGGIFPDNFQELHRLKGVGDYTASAIASICFGKAEAVVDGNVYRVLARFAGIDTPIDSTAGRKQFKALAMELIDPAQPGDHNQAVMELGATVCTPKSPDCPHCPLQEKCIALATGKASSLPVKRGKTKTRDRYFNYLHIAVGSALYMRQRTGKDIWQGLYELPLIESEKPLTKRGLSMALGKAFGPGWSICRKQGAPRHLLSHQVIRAVFWSVAPPEAFTPQGEWELVPLKKLKASAVPRLIERWIRLLESESAIPRNSG